jgi:CheY-like chemotaxis protein
MARILVIDDEPSVLQAIEQALKVGKHTIISAMNGEHGVRRFQSDAPDLVITDLFMPDKDGVKTILELRKLQPDVRIIAISGNPLSEKVLPIAQKLGAIKVLQKPFSVAELLQSVQEALALPPESPNEEKKPRH